MRKLGHCGRQIIWHRGLVWRHFSARRREDNLFQVFNLPVSMRIDMEKLEKNYQDLQRKVHPDRFFSKSKEEQEISAVKSSEANEAYDTLQDPISRAKYILALNGVDMEDKTLVDDMELLEEIMREREYIASSELCEFQLKLCAEKYKGICQDCIEEATYLWEGYGKDALEPPNTLKRTDTTHI